MTEANLPRWEVCLCHVRVLQEKIGNRTLVTFCHERLQSFTLQSGVVYQGATETSCSLVVAPVSPGSSRNSFASGTSLKKKAVTIVAIQKKRMVTKPCWIATASESLSASKTRLSRCWTCWMAWAAAAAGEDRRQAVSLAGRFRRAEDERAA